MAGFYVSRQRYFSDNSLYVEIATGGKNKASKDVLPERYKGEQKSYKYPKDALTVACKIYKQWYHQYNTDENIKLSIVDEKLGNLVLWFDADDLRKAETWADQAFKNLVKCESCAKPVGSKKKAFTDPKLPGYYCNEVCISRQYRAIYGVEWKKNEK